MRAKAMLLTIFLFSVVATFFPYFSQAKPTVETEPTRELDQGWEYQWVQTLESDTGIPKTGWKRTDNVKELAEPRNGSEVLYLRNTIPPNKWKDPAIFISFMYGTFEVFQGSELIYHYGEIPDAETVTYKGYIRRHFIQLNETNPSTQLTIRSYSNGNLIGVAGAVSVGSYSTYLTDMVAGDFDELVIGSIELFIAVVAFFLFVKRRFDPLYFAFAVTAFCAALYSFSITGSKQFLIDSPYIWIFVFQLAVFFRSAFDLLLIDKLFGPGYKKLIRRLWQLHLSLATLAFLLSLINPDYFTWTRGIFEKLAGLEVLLVLLILIRVFLKSTSAKIYTIGYLAMAGFMVRDLLLFTGVLHLEKFYLVGHIGQFILILSVGIILTLEDRQSRRTASSY